MENLTKKEKISTFVNYGIIFIMIITFFFGLFGLNDVSKKKSKDELISLNENWSINGDIVDISDYKVLLGKDEKITLSYVTDETLYRNNNLLFYCDMMGIDVFVNDKKIYTVNRSEISGCVLVRSMVVVDLINVCIGDTVSIDIYNIRGDSLEYELPTIKAGTENSIKNSIFLEESITIFSFILSIAVLITFITYIFYASKTRKTMEKRFVSFGLFILVSTIWLFFDSNLANTLPLNIETTSLISLYLFKLLPLGLLFFVLRSFKSDRVILIRIMIILCYINIATGTLLSFLRVIPLNNLVFIDQTLFGLSVMATLFYVNVYARKYRNEPQQKITFIAFFVLLAFYISSLVCYYIYESKIYHDIMSIAIVIFYVFIFLIVIYFSRVDSKLKKKVAEEREYYRLMSYKDELTGLNNIRAYEEDLKSFETQKTENTILVVIDINDVKRINDTYGHGAGNVLITQCAQCITKTFSKYGRCYRIRGNEFALIIDYPSFDIEKRLSYFNELIKASNGDRIYKLSVAVGYAKYKDNEGKMLEDLRFQADLDMYKDKNRKRLVEIKSKNEIWQKMIDTIISIFEVKDPYTAQHSNRVSYLSKFIAESMGFTELAIQDIFLAGKLHDIGKIGISDKILTKKARLNDEEFEEIKKHTIIGEKIIKSSGGMDKIANIIRHHHEKYNGTGYPDRISKDDIPIESRILAIADSIDAMTSDRCYRKALTYDECKEEITRNLGVQYDPIVGKYTLENWDELVSIHKELRNQLD